MDEAGLKLSLQRQLRFREKTHISGEANAANRRNKICMCVCVYVSVCVCICVKLENLE